MMDDSIMNEDIINKMKALLKDVGLRLEIANTNNLDMNIGRSFDELKRFLLTEFLDEIYANYQIRCMECPL